MIRIQIGKEQARTLEDKDIEGFKAAMDIKSLGDSIYSLIYKDKSHEIIIMKVNRDAKTILLSIDGISAEVKISNKMDLLLEKMGIDTSSAQKMTVLKAPMPGLVLEWYVSVGDVVKVGDKLLTLEAMKMENVIKSSGEGVIKKISVNKGVAVEKGQLLIEFK